MESSFPLHGRSSDALVFRHCVCRGWGGCRVTLRVLMLGQVTAQEERNKFLGGFDVPINPSHLRDRCSKGLAQSAAATAPDPSGSGGLVEREVRTVQDADAGHPGIV